jgi:hypothetical protein
MALQMLYFGRLLPYIPKLHPAEMTGTNTLAYLALLFIAKKKGL